MYHILNLLVVAAIFTILGYLIRSTIRNGPNWWAWGIFVTVVGTLVLIIWAMVRANR